MFAPPPDMPESAQAGMRAMSELATLGGAAPGAESLREFHSYATELCGNPPLTWEKG